MAELDQPHAVLERWDVNQPPVIIDLRQDVTRLGRLAENDVGFDKLCVSKRHAVITRKLDCYYLEDVGSKYGTFLNGQRLPLNRPVRLAHEDRIRVADTILIFRDPTSSTLVSKVELNEDASVVLGSIDSRGSSSSDILQLKAAARIRAIMDFGRDVGELLEPQAIYKHAIRRLLKLFPQAERAIVMVPSGANPTDLEIRAIRSQDENVPSRPVRQTPRVVEQSMGKGQAIVSKDLWPDGYTSVSMCAPLLDVGNHPLGLIQLDAEPEADGESRRFTQDDLLFLVAITTQVSIALGRARLHEAELRLATLEHEHKLASEVQHAFLPSRHPELDGYEFWDYYAAAQHVGGDYYDYLPGMVVSSESETPARGLMLTIGDVAGKGMPAALMMGRLCSSVRLILNSVSDPEGILTRLNEEFQSDARESRFITFLLAQLDPIDNRLRVAIAGHPAPFIKRADGSIDRIECETGGPLGAMPESHYSSIEIDLQPGDIVVLFTDGVSEARDEHFAPFCEGGIQTAIQSAGPGAEEVGEAILHALAQHVGMQPQFDDIALVCFGRNRSERV